jgi:hypothetical protein
MNPDTPRTFIPIDEYLATPEARERMQTEPMNTDTPRTDAASFSSRDPLELMMTSQQLERELSASRAEVASLRELLEKVLFELEKVPFQNPKLTAFTAHRLADRYREQLNQLTK